MVPFTSLAGATPVQVPVVPAAFATSREAAQGTQFQGSLSESVGSAAQVPSAATAAARTPGDVASVAQPCVDNAAAYQSKAQPLVEPTALTPPVHRPMNVHVVSTKIGHASQPNARTSKKTPEGKTESEGETQAKRAPDAEPCADANDRVCAVNLPGNLIPSTPPAAHASSQLAVGAGSAVREASADRTKAITSSSKQSAPARSEGEPTRVLAKPGIASAAVLPPDAVKDSGEHHTEPTTSHAAQQIGVPATLSALHAARLSTLQPAALDIRSALTSTPVEQPGDSRTLAATASSLEVGISSGTHGWLRVRAELNQTGTVTAALVASSATSAENLTRHLPALSEYLAQETTKIGSIVVHTSSASGAAAGDSHSTDPWAGLSNSAGGERDRTRQNREQNLSQQFGNYSGAERNSDGTSFGLHSIRAAWPGVMPALHSGQGGPGTHWVSVRV